MSDFYASLFNEELDRDRGKILRNLDNISPRSSHGSDDIKIFVDQSEATNRLTADDDSLSEQRRYFAIVKEQSAL